MLLFAVAMGLRRVMVLGGGDNSDPVTLETTRFMAVVWGAEGQGDGPTSIVQLDGYGERVGALRVGDSVIGCCCVVV
jgi:hypothetical protein